MTLHVRASKSIFNTGKLFKVSPILSAYSHHCRSRDKDNSNDNNLNDCTSIVREFHFRNLIFDAIKRNKRLSGAPFREVILEPDLLVTVLDLIRGHPLVAFRFYSWVKRQLGFRGSACSFSKVLDILVSNKLMGSARLMAGRVGDENLDTILDFLIGGFVNSIMLLDFLLYVSVKDGMVERCLWIFNKMVLNGLLSNVKNCNRILKLLRDRNLLNRRKEGYKMMGEYGIKPTIFTYNTLLDALCKEGEMHQALDLLVDMQVGGCDPTDVTYNVLINGLSKKGGFDVAKGMIWKMLSSGGFSIHL